MIEQPPFDITTVTDNKFKSILINEIENKMKKCSVSGATPKRSNCRIWDINISDEDFEQFKKSDKAYNLLLKDYKKQFKDKVTKYKDLKAKLDFCLSDVKPYLKLIDNIDKFTYCGAITELEAFNKRYLNTRAVSKAVYRARLQQFNKMEC